MAQREGSSEETTANEAGEGSIPAAELTDLADVLREE